ncbi:hypothetical protein [Saccharopolyspora pogona]|uniref:hypothetical protein n=1 Tax=Saccharopolyspora pogona TaxID=333966 RepID=UPI001688DFE2|nr:hypothetical protein [Saccharopolyspora pogona]
MAAAICAVDEITGNLNVATEVAHLLALNHGLGTSILIGQRTVAEARPVLRSYLDRIFAGLQSPSGTRS